MSRYLSTSALARASAKHPWRTVSAWVIVLVLAVSTIGILGLRTTTAFDFANEPESIVGLETLEDAGLIDPEPTDEVVIVARGQQEQTPHLQAESQGGERTPAP